MCPILGKGVKIIMRNLNFDAGIMKYRLLSYLISLMAVSCTGFLPDVRDGGEQKENVDLFTKGNGDGKAYMFYLEGAGETAGVLEYGTYADVTPGEPLLPCAVDPVTGMALKNNEGNVVYDSSKGLRAAKNGEYNLFIVHPAIQMEDLGGGIRGYSYSRNQAGVYLSEAVPVILSGVYLSKGDGVEYIYNAGTQVLRQPRSLMKLNFACGSDIQQTTLRSIYLKNFIDEGCYLPVQQRFHYSSVVKSHPLYIGAPIPVTTGNTIPLDIEEYILSMDYGELGANHLPLWAQPSLEITTGEGSGEVTFNAVLGLNFKPQNIYEFTIRINSLTVNIVVSVRQWTELDGSDDISNTQTWEMSFPLKDGDVLLYDWDRVDVPGATI